ncbi:hypothetical protein LCGC14_3122000 [marine sediment metagenome]|uniref:Type 4 fimbrial biogenesis protein PilX N-terminal domain-containing protein n=1 Tax=marine sediment metagenome TaxID=412755 RepID=A0A0F8W289_9ZZZZ
MVSELQLNKSGIISMGENERGFVILGSLVILSLIALVASIAVITTTTEVKISSNYKTGTKALYAAKQAN